MLIPSARRSTSIRRTLGASAIGAVIGTVGVLAPMASAAPESEVGPVVISFYDYPSAGDTTPDLAFFMLPEGYPSGPLRGRLLNADGRLKSPTVEVLSYNAGTIKVEAIVAGDVAELYDAESGVVVARSTYDGQPGLTLPLCAGSSSAQGTRTAGQPIGNVEAFRPVPGAQHSGDVTINPGTVAASDPAGSTWSATFERPVAAGDQVTAFASSISAGVRTQSMVQRAVTECPAPPAASQPAAQPSAPAPASPVDKTAPVGTSTPVKKGKKPTLASIVKQGFAFTVTAQENATLKATLTLKTTSGKGKKKKVKLQLIGSTTQPVTAGVATDVKLKATGPSSSKLKKAARQPGSKLVSSISLTDAAGNVATLPPTTISVPKP